MGLGTLPSSSMPDIPGDQNGSLGLAPMWFALLMEQAVYTSTPQAASSKCRQEEARVAKATGWGVAGASRAKMCWFKRFLVKKSTFQQKFHTSVSESLYWGI